MAFALGGVITATNPPTAAPTPAASSTAAADLPALNERTYQSAPTTTAPTVSDFALTAKILTKECFGTAGCNITFRVQVAYGGPALDPATTYEVTYEVRGVADGPQINTLTVQGDQSSTDETEMASTAGAGVKLVIVPTQVQEK